MATTTVADEATGTPGSWDRPCLIVVADGSTESTRRLVWALKEAARRDATVLAVALLSERLDEDARTAARVMLSAQVRHALDEADVQDRCRTAFLDCLVFDALAAAANRGADLVVVGHHRTAVLRRALPRRPSVRPSVPFAV